MELSLDLSEMDEDKRIPFCKYVIATIQHTIEYDFDTRRGAKLEKYINDNNIIDWQYGGKYITVFDLYRLYGSFLQVDRENDTKFIIGIDKNVNIPDSYTSLYSIISLLEYGTLSVGKCGFISRVMSTLVENMDTYARMFFEGEGR